MQEKRKNPSDNERQVLFDEVYGCCPICGNKLTHTKNNRIYKIFEIAHIYPLNPTPEEVELLKNEEKLSLDVNDLKNLLAVCKSCHNKFDNPRTIEEYRSWIKIKRKIIQDNNIKDFYSLFNIEDEIYEVLKKLNSTSLDEEMVPLSLDSLKIDDKVNETLPYILKRSIKNGVVDYFEYIKKNFIELDKLTPNKFNTVAAQIKSFYCKCIQINNNQEIVYYHIVDWLDKKTGHYSKPACEIIVAYFVQNCEVFS